VKKTDLGSRAPNPRETCDCKGKSNCGHSGHCESRAIVLVRLFGQKTKLCDSCFSTALKNVAGDYLEVVRSWQ